MFRVFSQRTVNIYCYVVYLKIQAVRIEGSCVGSCHDPLGEGIISSFLTLALFTWPFSMSVIN